MAIFGVLDFDPVVQVDDKIRLKAVQSFVSKDEAAVTLVRIDPETTVEGFIDVTGTSSDDWFLDWSYSGTSRSLTVTLEITTDGAPVTFTKDIQVNTVADDNLFSDDDGIFTHETELKDLVPDGKSSFTYVHRKAKQLILDWFNEKGYRDSNGQKLTDAAFQDKEEVRRMSEMWTLALIYKDLSNSVDDKFDQKSALYKSRMMDATKRLMFKLDLDGDATINDGEFVLAETFRLSRL